LVSLPCPGDERLKADLTEEDAAMHEKKGNKIEIERLADTV